jgi:hypothetical protein
MGAGYIGWAARGGVSSVDPCAREKPTSPTLNLHTEMTQFSRIWLSPSREKGGVTAKNLYGCGGRCYEKGAKGMRDGMKFLTKGSARRLLP